MIISKETKLLGQDMIENHHEWRNTYYEYTNGKISIWTGNGIPFIDTYPETKAFNLIEKIYLKRCIKKSLLKTGVKND